MPLLPRRLLGQLALGAAVAGLALIEPRPAQAFDPFLIVPEPAEAEATPAFRYANMTDAEALAELDRRQVLYSKIDSVPGVRAPVRLTGRLHGVYFHSSLPPDERVTSLFEILDARLALALDDFAEILERHDIDEVVHFSMYRPNVAAPDHGVNDEPEAGKPVGWRAQATRVGRSRTAEAKAGKGPGAKGAGKAAPPKVAAAKGAPPKAGHAAAPGLDAKAAKEGGKGAGAQLSGAQQKTPNPAPDKPEAMVTAPAAGANGANGANGAKKAGTPAKAGPAAANAKRQGAPGVRHEAPAKPAAAPHRTSWAPPGTRHPAGLAIDVGMLHKRDGRWLSIAGLFEGHIGDRTCGEGARTPADADAKELHELVCEQADEGLFTYVLTPNYNAAHADHFHMEIKPGVHWFLYH